MKPNLLKLTLMLTVLLVIALPNSVAIEPSVYQNLVVIGGEFPTINEIEEEEDKEIVEEDFAYFNQMKEEGNCHLFDTTYQVICMTYQEYKGA